MKRSQIYLLAINLGIGINFYGCFQNSEDTSFQTKYHTPDYSNVLYTNSTWLDTLPQKTSVVYEYQNIGKLLGNLVQRENGRIKMNDSLWVKLTEISKNTCPQSLSDCTIKSSDSLKIGNGAMVVHLDSVLQSVQNQGERGTCVAFALTGATEILLKRTGIQTKLSNQFAYFLGKKLTNSWEYSGLAPTQFFQTLSLSPSLFGDENSWPYNPYQLNCSLYQQTYPTKTCSATEAQGGGINFQLPDPAINNTSGARLLEIHQLYASLGRIKKALYQGFPVLAAISANPDFSIANFKKGVVSWAIQTAGCPSGPCGHAIVVIGYQDDPNVQGGGYLIVKNSWGTSWGDQGLAYLTYTWVENSLLDAQAIVRADYQ